MTDVDCLLVEDSLRDQIMFEGVVRTLPGIVCHVAETWDAATRLMPRSHMMVVDLVLPPVGVISPDVPEMVENVCRLAASGLPVIVYSGIESPEVVNRCKDAGVVAYLRKDQTAPHHIRSAVQLAASKTKPRKDEAELSRLKSLSSMNLEQLIHEEMARKSPESAGR